MFLYITDDGHTMYSEDTPTKGDFYNADQGILDIFTTHNGNFVQYYEGDWKGINKYTPVHGEDSE